MNIIFTYENIDVLIQIWHILCMSEKNHNRICNNIIYNVVVSPEDISMTKKTTSTNQTDEMEEDATTGMINIRKNL